MTEFLLKNSGKMVNVKVISIGRPKFMPTEGRELLNKNHQVLIEINRFNAYIDYILDGKDCRMHNAR